jgi:hypothetical protein
VRSLDIGERIANINYSIGVVGSGRGKGGVEFLGCARLNSQQSHTGSQGYARYLFR